MRPSPCIPCAATPPATALVWSSDVHLVRKPTVIPIPEQGVIQAPLAQPPERVQHEHVLAVNDVGRDEACGVDERSILVSVFNCGAREAATSAIEIGGDSKIVAWRHDIAREIAAIAITRSHASKPGGASD